MRVRILLLFIFISVYGLSQSWPYESSRWIYPFSAPGMWGTYEIITDGDSLIQGVSCKRVLMNKISNWCLNADCDVYTAVSGFQDYALLHQQGDSILRWDGTAFRLLYDFGAEVGDQWLVSVSYLETDCSDSAIVEVMEAGIMGVLGEERRYIDIQTVSNAQVGLSGRAIEGMGLVQEGWSMYGANAFLPGILACDGSFIYDGDDTSFSCYYDDDLGVYSPSGSECEFLKIESYTIQSLDIYPNPTRDFVMLEFPENQDFSSLEIEMVTLLGEIIPIPQQYESEFSSTSLQLDMREVPEGLYILKGQTGKAVYSGILIKQ